MRRSLLLAFFASIFLLGIAQGEYPEIKVSDDIKLIKLSDTAYVHVSVSEMKGFGKVSSNGLILVDKEEAILFDTPATNEQTATLYDWFLNTMNTKITAFVPNHWHEDCMGGLEYLHSKGVKSYACNRTIDIARKKGFPVPQSGFRKALKLYLHDIEIQCYYPGSGHALDNIVVWVPSAEILFTGCMVKDMNSGSLGNTADGNVKEWPKTIKRVGNMFSNAKVVIPGHGSVGGTELLKHTQDLFLK